MFKLIKTFLYKFLPMKLYLMCMYYGFVLMYNTRILLLFSEYRTHYYVRKYINKGDTIIDIGANLGHYVYIFLKQVGLSGKIYAVEPVSCFCEVMSWCFRHTKNVFIMPFALGEKNNVSVKLGISSNDSYIRTGLPKIISNSELQDLNKFQYIFDSKMNQGSVCFTSFKTINYIKIDVEGHEKPILSDLKDIIKKHQPILQIESNDLPALLIFLKEINYKLDTSAPEGDFIYLPIFYFKGDHV